MTETNVSSAIDGTTLFELAMGTVAVRGQAAARVLDVAQRLARRMVHDPQLVDDVAQRTVELLLLKPSGSYDPRRGNALGYVRTLVRTAVRDVTAEYAAPGRRTRDAVSRGSRLEASAAAASLDQVVHSRHGRDRGTLRDLFPDPHDRIGEVLEQLQGDYLIREVATIPTVGRALKTIYFGDVTLTEAALRVGLSRIQLRRLINRWVTISGVRAA